MTKERIQRSLKRMAHEINEQDNTNHSLLLFGINQRGYAVANLLGDMLSEIRGKEVEAEQLLLDLEETSDEWRSKATEEHFTVIVDDVIFSGQTMFRALKEIDNLFNPNEIHTAVLIDRGHRKYPIKAEFCGMELPTKLNEHVTVQTEGQKLGQVQLMHR
jgi:pyrimidine operon attenuation protein/uracil phosphoribosyltransferase